MKLLKLFSLTCLTAMMSLTAVADWILIDNFEDTTLEDLNIWKRFAPQGDVYIDQFDQTDPNNTIYYADPGPPVNNQQNQIHSAYTLPVPIPQGGQATLRYRLYFFTSGPFNMNIGVGATPVQTDPNLSVANGRLTAPVSYNNFESQLGWTDSGVLTVRNGNSFVNTDLPIPVGEWITVYYLIDNATDTTRFYYQLDSMSEPEIITMADGTTDALFRNGTTDPLVTLQVVSAGSASGNVSIFLLDDIYYDPTGFNLDGADVPEGPAVWAGYLLDDNGDVDTGDWIGAVYAANNPWVYPYKIDSYVYIPSEMVSEEGAWTFFPYQNSPREDWVHGSNGIVYTGEFMRWIYDTGDDWVYSYSFDRWIYLPEIEAAQTPTGAWGFLPVKPEPAVDADYVIPAFTSAPMIDGFIDPAEWAEANMYEHSHASLIATGIGTSTFDNRVGSPQPDAPRASADVYVGATKQGLYVAFDVLDNELTIAHEFGSAGNGSDGVQLGIDVNPNPTNRNSTVLFDINPASLVDGAPVGPPSVFARWATDGYDVTWGVQVASNIHQDGYSIEVMIPWSLVNSFGIENPLDVGSDLRMTVALLDQDAGVDGDESDILWDAGSGTMGVGNAANWPFAAIGEELVAVANNYSIPMVSTAPTIDGTIDPNEWMFASYTEASYDNWVVRSLGNTNGEQDPDASRSEGGIYLMGTDEALYMAAQISAPNISISNSFGVASNNQTGVQWALSMDPNPTRRDDASVLWDFTPATVVDGELNGPANIFGRWGITPGFDEDWGIEAAGSFTDDGYIIEVKMPWEVMLDSVRVPVSNALQKGDVISIGFVVIDMSEDGSVNELLVDFGAGSLTIGQQGTWNKAVIRD